MALELCFQLTGNWYALSQAQVEYQHLALPETAPHPSECDCHKITLGHQHYTADGKEQVELYTRASNTPQNERERMQGRPLRLWYITQGHMMARTVPSAEQGKKN